MIVNRDYFEEFELDLTGVCNLSCPLCSRNYVHAQHMVYRNERKLPDIIKQLDTFKNLKRAFVAGQVSEPTLYKDFIKYIKYLKSRDIYIEIYTNGNTRNDEFWIELCSILDINDQIHFTICGSTQELHEKYRVGSSLDEILNNAKFFKEKGIDYCQFIKFEYNKLDEDNVKLFNFSNHYTVGTEGVRNENEKIKDPGFGVKPEMVRDKTIKWIFDNQPKGDCIIKCKSIADKKIYINQSGKVSACYIHYEYEPEHTFEGNDFDYTSILDFKFKDCFLCEKKTKYKIDKFGLDFVC